MQGNRVRPESSAETDESRLSTILKNHYGIQNWIYTGRASGALHLLLKTLCNPGETVALPDITCHDLAQTILSSGLNPEFLEINLQDYNLDIANLQSNIDKLEIKPKVLIAVHSFGHKLDIDSIAKICRANGIFLIEDVCQLPPFNWERSNADAILTSFGHTKPINAGGGGALGVTDSKLFEKVKIARQKWNNKPLNEKVGKTFYKDYYELIDAIKKERAGRSEIGELIEQNQNLILRGTRLLDFKSVIGCYSAITSSSSERIAKAEYCLQNLASIRGIILPAYPPNTVPWRFTFRVSENIDRDDLVSDLRQLGLHASSWYRALSSDFGINGSLMPNAKLFEESVVNLWVDATIDYSYLDACFEAIKAHSTNSTF
jgi:dTDP-4-amino-4,6-dideoxygalactose transaminase